MVGCKKSDIRWAGVNEEDSRIKWKWKTIVVDPKYSGGKAKEKK